MQPTDEQQTFINECRDGDGSICLEAVAGSGKTSTLVIGVNAIAESGSMLSIAAIAFNKKIAVELAARMDSSVLCKTMNAIGHGAWIKKINCQVQLNTRKNFAGFKKVFGDDFVPREELEDIYKLTALAKQFSIVPNSPNDDIDTWEAIVNHFDLAIDDEYIPNAVDMCRQVLQWGITEAMDGHIDFDDQLYMPINFGGIWRSFDVVLIDEAQDISGIQRDILRKVLKPNGRLIAVGDPHQAIYGFRGAASDSMQLIAEEFNCQTMGLTYSFRCPKLIVKEAQEYVPYIKPAPGASTGSVVTINEWSSDQLSPKSVIICRNTKPLVDMAFRLISRNVNCYVLGRDIGFGLIQLIKKMHTKDMVVLEAKLEEYRSYNIKRHNRMNRPERAEAVNDKVSTLNIIMDNLEENATMKDLEKMIGDLFSGPKNGVCLSTIHKAKGLEWEMVYFLDSDLIPSRYATQGWQLQQEHNLAYVGITRAINTLAYVTSKGLK